MNNKGLNWTLVAVIIIAVLVIAAVVVGISMSGTAPTVGEQLVTVYIDGTKQTGNYTVAQSLSWDAVQPGNTYTKNFTVVSNADQALTLRLYTTEPYGATQTWQKNGTSIAPSGVIYSTIVLSLNDTAASGKYTWKLLAVNGTATPTPTPTATPGTSPSPTPTPETYEYSLYWHDEEGVENVTIKVNTDTPFAVFGEETQPKTYLFTEGDKITFTANVLEGYQFVRWEFSDGTSPIGDAKTTLTPTGNFTITAVVFMPEEP